MRWDNVANADFTDELGRSFRWTSLKDKRIYMCGHGLHCFKDGYTVVPQSTTVNFYQTYGRFMLQTPSLRTGLNGFISGAITWVPERSFHSGQSCPDMT